ncbi:MAG TPA: CoF synthetase [Pricia sp.]|nr:CoF synthetase [Pricia sp.]
MFFNVRNSLFWFSDWLKGGHVQRHYSAVKKIQEDHTSDFALSEKKKYLTTILRHAQETVPYYRDLGMNDAVPDGIDENAVDVIQETALEDFPVVNKYLIKQNPDSFRSDTYLDKKTLKATTSGSTGTPFTVLHDLDKKKRHQADVRFYWKTVGHFWGTKFYYLRSWNQQNRKSKNVQKIQNIVPIDVFKMNDGTIGDLLHRIKADKDPKSILGYSSALDCIVKYMEMNSVDMSQDGVISVVAMSEALDGPTKKALQDGFGCPVVSRYANIENGMLAQQTAGLPDDFLINQASYHIEILSMQADLPVEEGKMGRIVVTDLFNRALPMIRYDTGDLGILGKSETDGKTHFVLKKVEGRKMDIIYDTHGEPISSFTIGNSMWKYPELAQYQFIQRTEKEYEFKLNPLEKFQRGNELIEEFKGYLGSDARIKISYVEEIPLLSSGKRKKVLNLVNSKPVEDTSVT